MRLNHQLANDAKRMSKGESKVTSASTPNAELFLVTAIAATVIVAITTITVDTMLTTRCSGPPDDHTNAEHNHPNAAATQAIHSAGCRVLFLTIIPPLLPLNKTAESFRSRSPRNRAAVISGHSLNRRLDINAIGTRILAPNATKVVNKLRITPTDSSTSS